MNATKLWDAIKTFWPILFVVAGGLMGYGSLHNQVEQLQAERPSFRQDHDAVTRIEQKQEDMKETVDKMDTKLDKVLDRLSNPQVAKAPVKNLPQPMTASVRR